MSAAEPEMVVNEEKKSSSKANAETFFKHLNSNFKANVRDSEVHAQCRKMFDGQLTFLNYIHEMFVLLQVVFLI